MVMLKIHPWDIRPILKGIRYTERKCSDGQCCSYALDDPNLPTRSFDKYYWVLQYRHKLYSYVHYLLRAGCPNLEVNFSEYNDTLYIGTSCKIYSDRPQQCQDFGTKVKCNFEEYVENIKERHYYYFLFLLVLDREQYLDKYPFLQTFDLSHRFLQIGRSIAGSYVSNGIYIPMPADGEILPARFPHAPPPLHKTSLRKEFEAVLRISPQ